MRNALLFATLMLSMQGILAGPLPALAINDPSGDDHGTSTLSYPQRSDFQPGDLDLLQLQISRDEDGYWFEAKFRNPIRDPAAAQGTASPEALSNFARKGFYQFNLDVYIDTDRIAGSGNTSALPGRNAGIAPTSAWEKAVILTPQPELMRQQLLGALNEQFPARKPAQTEASVDQSTFFPTRIRVRGKSIAFFVPASFITASEQSGWGITAMVTGAVTTIPAGISLFPSTLSPLDRLQLGAMQPAAGHPKDTFGYSGSTVPSAVVDMLSSSAEQQVPQFAARNNLDGFFWATWGGSDTPSAMASTPTVKIGDTTPPAPANQLLPPPSAPAAKQEASPAKAERQTEPTIAKRLQTLQQLFEQKLIDEAEYKQQRLRILNEL